MVLLPGLGLHGVAEERAQPGLLRLSGDRAVSVIEVLERVEALLSIVRPRSHTREYLETLREVRGVLAAVRGPR